jgi:bifunctional non-homologous end joining protein LigD
VRLLTRNGNDWTAKLPGIAADVAALGVGSGWIDGEIVVLNDAGASDFGALQNAFEAGGAAIRYFVFDLPYLDGHDLRACRLEERRRLLRERLGAGSERLRFSDAIEAEGHEILRNACRLRLEGVIGKRLGSPYVSRRSPDWIKLKCTLRQEFVIGGYTEPQGSRTGLGALLLGIHDREGRLRFAGSVGTGFDVKTLTDLRRRLAPLETTASPFVDKARQARGTWVAPDLVAEVSFAEWTRDGKVRHAVFHGLRSDKPASAIQREEPAPEPRSERRDAGGDEPSSGPIETAASAVPATKVTASAAESRGTAKNASRPAGRPTLGDTAKRVAAKAAAEPTGQSTADAPAAAPVQADDRIDTTRRPAPTNSLAAPVRITHPERVIDPSTQRTKRDLIDYYLQAGRRLLPHLATRPVALVRAPSGIAGTHFFQKHSGSLRIEDLRQLPAALDPGHPPLIEIASFTALISAAQMNVVEFHTWNATAKAIEKPDRMTFDLDPGEGVEWRAMLEAARLTHRVSRSSGCAPS